MSVEPKQLSEQMSPHRRGRYALVAACVYYLAVAWFGTQALLHFGILAAPDPLELREQGASRLLPLALLRLPAVLLFVLALVWNEHLRAACSSRPKEFWGYLLGAGLVALALDFLNLVPWFWRLRGYEAIGYVHWLVDGKQFLAIALYFITWGVVSPVMEEVVFRYSILGTIWKRTSSAGLAVTASTLMFVGAHYFPHFDLSAVPIRQGLSLVVIGVSLGLLTIWNRGRVAPAIAAHAGINLTEMGYLVIALAASPSE